MTFGETRLSPNIFVRCNRDFAKTSRNREREVLLDLQTYLNPIDLTAVISAPLSI